MLWPVGLGLWGWLLVGALRGHHDAEEIEGGCCSLGGFLRLFRHCCLRRLGGYGGGCWLLLFTSAHFLEMPQSMAFVACYCVCPALDSSVLMCSSAAIGSRVVGHWVDSRSSFPLSVPIRRFSLDRTDCSSIIQAPTFFPSVELY